MNKCTRATSCPLDHIIQKHFEEFQRFIEPDLVIKPTKCLYKTEKVIKEL